MKLSTLERFISRPFPLLATRSDRTLMLSPLLYKWLPPENVRPISAPVGNSVTRTAVRRGKHVAPRASPLERKIDRTLTNWSCTMANAAVNGDHMPWQELDSSIVKINEEPAFQCQETLIGVRMTVPMVSLRHSAYTNFMIVDFSN